MASPHSHIPFSAQFYALLTFGNLSSTIFPSILSPSAIRSYAVVNTGIAHSESDNCLNLLQPIPHLHNSLEIVKEFGGFAHKARSHAKAHVFVMKTGRLSKYVYSEMQLHLAIELQNQAESVALAGQFWTWLCRSDHHAATNFFHTYPICSPIPGLLTQVPSYFLGCLVGEDSVFDSVVDLHLELMYLSARSLCSFASPIICPVPFLASLLQLHHQPTPHFNTELSTLCRYIQHLTTTNKFNSIAFVDCLDGHYTSYFYNATGTLRYGDSLGDFCGPRLQPIRAAFNWSIGGIHGLQQFSTLEPMGVALQEPGSQSCALASVNGIEQHLGLHVPKWTGDTAVSHRIRWPDDTMTHVVQVLQFSEATPWFGKTVVPVTSPHSDAPPVSWNNSYAWSCWNVKELKLGHPFFSTALPRAKPTTPNTAPSISTPSDLMARYSTASSSPIHIESEPPSPSAQMIDLTILLSSPQIPLNPKDHKSRPPVIILLDSDSDETTTPKASHIVRLSNSGSEAGSEASRTRSPSIESLPDLNSHAALQRRRHSLLAEGDTFRTLDDAIAAVQDDEEAGGFKMQRGQSFQDGGGLKKVTMRCSSYQGGPDHHQLSIHPGNRRRGKTIRTECMAHVNINQVTGSTHYYLSLVDTEHNHPPVIPVGGTAQRPPTARQRKIVSTYSTDGSFSRRQIKQLLRNQCSDHPLEDRQITNLINQSQAEA
ncbi:hypothetical protein FS837_003939 [Tulasnella sp. UAMH 9824]|nr:hypothetical protein FS837_003939 [Tulasnella sp. UAMH 9824]